MKKTTRKIMDQFPYMEQMINEFGQSNELTSLSDTEKTFLKLAQFFERPEEKTFDLQDMYGNLDNDWLELALKLIVEFFREDTSLIDTSSFMFMRQGEDYLNEQQFVQYLVKQGLKRHQAATFTKNAKVPAADLQMNGIPYWKKETVLRYCDQELLRVNL
ncbi:hypothetical protein [Peribacillus sp. SCS-155]|uniref:hypothetical protein n=1 Tax=Peribacillus sedimenti TaxID=3115297 RepID=UPI0039058179